MSEDKDLELLYRILQGGDTNESDTKSSDKDSALKSLTEGALKNEFFNKNLDKEDTKNTSNK